MPALAAAGFQPHHVGQRGPFGVGPGVQRKLQQPGRHQSPGGALDRRPLCQPLVTPQELNVAEATYLNGLAEVVGELRRRTLDILRHGYSAEAERLLGIMDDIYSVLVTIDYPDAITNGLRRQTDLARGIIEKTRGDITFSLRGEHLEQAIGKLIVQLNSDQAEALKRSVDESKKDL